MIIGACELEMTREKNNNCDDGNQSDWTEMNKVSLKECKRYCAVKICT